MVITIMVRDVDISADGTSRQEEVYSSRRNVLNIRMKLPLCSNNSHLYHRENRIPASYSRLVNRQCLLGIGDNWRTLTHF